MFVLIVVKHLCVISVLQSMILWQMCKATIYEVGRGQGWHKTILQTDVKTI